MSKLVFTVEVNSDDEQVETEYLAALRDAFVSIVELASWGYSNDEVFASSRILDNRSNG